MRKRWMWILPVGLLLLLLVGGCLWLDGRRSQSVTGRIPMLRGMREAWATTGRGFDPQDGPPALVQLKERAFIIDGPYRSVLAQVLKEIKRDGRRGQKWDISMEGHCAFRADPEQYGKGFEVDVQMLGEDRTQVDITERWNDSLWDKLSDWAKGLFGGRNHTP